MWIEIILLLLAIISINYYVYTELKWHKSNPFIYGTNIYDSRKFLQRKDDIKQRIIFQKLRHNPFLICVFWNFLFNYVNKKSKF